MSISEFIRHHYRHFNAATVREAADAFVAHLEGGGRMMVTLAGAMSTAELGLSLAELIRRDRVHAICTTGANLEEDIFNLVAHDHYRRIPDWRNLTPRREKELELAGLNRVTDTCIPEDEAFRIIEKPLLDLWREAEAAGERRLPHEFIYALLQRGLLAGRYQIDPADSWLVAAAENELPLFVPGWEDSTLGNFFVSHVLAGRLASFDVVRPGTAYMGELAEWYARTTCGKPLAELERAPADDVASAAMPAGEALATVGFFQIGGGIAGDFPICVVPMIHQDLRRRCPYWGYFCQISDSTTSYGSYSGAIPTEKITWGKLDVDTPKFVIESDATIVAPLIFAYALGW
ncbi:MAG: deoxyhypusine synthase family protein [Gemmatimonadota bacterium]|nr:MAG: deoxyhypusine synthase family protein [Gemmatimonadota bacterium]